MRKIKIVKATGNTRIKKIEALAKTIWTRHYTPIIGPAQVRYMLEKFQSRKAIRRQIKEEGIHYFLIQKGSEKPVGYLAVQPEKNPGELFLSKFYLLRQERGKGYGKKALRFIEAFGRKRELKKIRLVVNKKNADSLAAYLKMGFQKSGEIVTDVGEGFVMDDFILEKEILPGKPKKEKAADNNPYTVYILECRNHTYYTGITKDMVRRFKEHQRKSTHYTSYNPPLRILYTEIQPDRSAALKREAQIKRWPKAKKTALIEGAVSVETASRIQEKSADN